MQADTRKLIPRGTGVYINTSQHNLINFDTQDFKGSYLGINFPVLKTVKGRPLKSQKWLRMKNKNEDTEQHGVTG